ncbi:LacI family DNA-binding transcriptional regulator [Aerococcaceae bacterium 50-4]
MASIKDIAKISGYAPATISRYLNQSGYVSEKAANSIQKVIEELDYSPNQSAINLSIGKTHKIGVILPYLKHPYFVEIIRGLIDAAVKSDHQLLFLPSNYDQQVEINYLKQLKSKAVDALIFTSRSVSTKVIDAYSKYGRIVCLEEMNSDKISSVFVKRSTGYSQLFNWLKTQNIHNIALLFSRVSDESDTYRTTMSAFRQSLPHISFKAFNNIHDYQDNKKTIELLQQYGPFDCVLSNNDDLAVGLKLYFEKHNQLPLIISQEAQLSGHLNGIPSIDNHTYQLGAAAFEAAKSSQIVTQAFDSTFILDRTMRN